MMGTISHTPYFLKYFWSNKLVAARGPSVSSKPKPPGAAKCLIRQAIDLKGIMKVLLSRVMVAFIKEPSHSSVHVSTEVKALLNYSVAPQMGATFLGRICNQVRNPMRILRTRPQISFTEALVI